jgi:hypothetical protein
MTFALAFKELHKKTLLRALENECGIGLFFIFSLIIVLYPFDSRAWSNGYGRLLGEGGDLSMRGNISKDCPNGYLYK